MKIKTKHGDILVDDEDAFWLLGTSRGVVIQPAKSHTRYVRVVHRATRENLGLLHRLILSPKAHEVVDHINGNGLDNRRENLRAVTQKENQQNRRVTTGRAKGVHFRESRGYWIARITVNGKIIHLGNFVLEEDAIAARLAAEPIYHPYRGKGTAQ
jgi:hypothetical protein